MKNLKILIFFILLIILTEKASSIQDLMFKPLTANPFEARVGSFYQFSDSKLRLDIGTSIDFASYVHNSETEIRAGADFFTFTRLRSENNFKFPVETSDYYFGLNTSVRGLLNCICTSLRIRVAHISSHLVDGMAEDTIFKRKPFVFSREFAEAVLAVRFDSLRVYGGLSYIFSTQPNNISQLVPQIGFDYHYLFDNGLVGVIGYDFKLTGISYVFEGANSAQAGVLIPTWGDIGLLLSAYFYEGASMHGMYYTERDSYSGIGFQILF